MFRCRPDIAEDYAFFIFEQYQFLVNLTLFDDLAEFALLSHLLSIQSIIKI